MQIALSIVTMWSVKIRKISIGLALFSVLVATTVSFNLFLKRLHYDDQRNRVQYALSRHSIRHLQALSGYDQSATLAILKNQIGVSAVIFPEYTLADYEKQAQVTVLSGHEIINTLRVGQMYHTILSRLRRKTPINPQATYIITDQVAIYKRLVDHLNLYFPLKSVTEYTGRIIQVNADKSRLMTVPLGFDPTILRPLVSFGFTIIPELRSYDTVSFQKFRMVMSELSDIDGVAAIKFANDFKFGQDRYWPMYVEEIQRKNVKLVIPEFLDNHHHRSDALMALSQKIKHDVVRVNQMYASEFSGVTFDQLFFRYMRALKERSPHMVVFPVSQAFSESDLYDKNNMFMKRVIDSFERSGGEQVSAFPFFPRIQVSFYESAAIGWGIFSGLYLLILILYQMKRGWHITAVLACLVAIYTGVMMVPSITTAVFGVVAAVVAPVLGIVVFFPNSDGSRRWYVQLAALVWYLARVLLVCVIAVLFLTALHSDPLYLNKISLFWGVKLSLLLPVILVGFFYFCGPRRMNSKVYVIRRLFRLPVTLYGLSVLIGVLLILLLYIFRSGNYFQPFYFEQVIRSTLETVFMIRPRFKEWLIGYPALMLGCWFAPYFREKGMIWLMNALGVIGLTSLINSFCHFHTPILISVYRSIWGIILGGIVAIIGYSCWQLGRRVLIMLDLIRR